MSKKSKILKLFLLIGILFHFSCEKEEIYEPKEENSRDLVVKHYKLSELKSKSTVYEKISKLAETKAKSNYLGRTVNVNDYGFSVETEDIMYIQDGDNYSYTFKIYRDTLTSLTENLVLKPKNDGSFETYLVQYNYAEEDKENYNNGLPVANKHQKTQIQLLDNIDTNVFFRGSGNQVEGGLPPLPSGCCWELIDYEATIDYDAGTWEVIDYYQINCNCGGGSGSGTGSGDGGNTGGWSGNGNTDGGSNPSSGNTGGTSGGVGSSGSSNSGVKPIITSPVGLDGEPIFEEDPCVQLKNITKPEQDNIKPVIDILKTHLNEDIEYSANFRKYLDSDPPEYLNEIHIGLDKHNSRLFMAQSWYGQIHTHPVGTDPMFSWRDLKALSNLYFETKAIYKQDVFIMIVCPNDKVYSLKLDNLEILNAKLDEDWNNLGNLTEKEKNDKLDLMMQDVFSSDSDIEKAFINRFKDYGISLYRANADITQWTKIELENPLAEEPVKKETPC